MARTLLPEGLWERIRPLLPEHPRRPGRPWVDDRSCLEGILFVLRSGVAWSLLPPQFGACGMTCWRRLRDWKRAGVWDRVHTMLLDELNAAGRLEPRVAITDSTSLRVIKGARRRARTRRTAAKAAANSTFSLTPKARRSPATSRPRMSPTA